MENINFKDYKVISLLHQGTKNIVFKAKRNSDGTNVIIKTNRSSYPLPQELASFQKEYNLIATLQHEDIPKVLEFIQNSAFCALVFEDLNGVSLKNYINKEPLSIDTFLKISINITNVIDYLHKNNIVHKDINPENILITNDLNVKLIDFSISSKLQSIEITNSINNLEGTLGYIAPEQTGRLNRAVDSRSDIYSVGITFFEMLTGSLPFKYDDPLNLIYAHLALTAPNLNTINPKIPPIIASIVEKMISKNPEDRYQTAEGLLFDLNQCLIDFHALGEIKPFTLGQKDLPSYLQFPSKLYGRDYEIKLLNDVIKKSVQKSQLVFVSGYSGTGKSALIQETISSMVEKHTIYLDGKFEHLKRNMPYSAFTQALKKFIKETLFEGPEKIQELKNMILTAVGTKGQVLIELVPEIELIIGKQPPIESLPPKETYNRFIGIMRELFRNISTPEHPLIFFMDDLQWADLGSFRLIESVIAKTPNCVFIGAYRNNEVKGPHPLFDLINQIKESSLETIEIELEPLKHNDVEHFIRDTFQTPNIVQLTELVIQKTLGNPFFMRQLLKYLNDKNFITFNSQKWCWVWDIEEIKKQNISDNVVQLLLEKLQELPIATRNSLSIAAAIGRSFELKTLAKIVQRSETKLLNDLTYGLKEGLISYPKQSQNELLLIEQGFKSDEPVTFQFTHDRIQQAAYELFNIKDLPTIHLKIARLGNLSLENLVFHFNKAIDLIESDDERRKLFEWNLQIAKKAKDATAYFAALNYLTVAQDLANRNHFNWTTDQPQLFELCMQMGECNFLLLNFEKAEEIFNDLKSKLVANNKKIEVFCSKTKLYTHLDRNNEAIEEAKKGLALFNIYFPKEASRSHVAAEFLKVKMSSMFKDLNNLQPMTNPEALAIIDLLHAMYPASYQTNPFLYGLVGLKYMSVVLQYGYPPYLFGFSTFISILLLRRDFKTALIYTDLTCRLNEKMGTAKDWADVEITLGLFALQWFDSFSNASKFLKQGTTLSLETGNYLFTGTGLMGDVLCHLRTGAPLEKLDKMNLEVCNFLKDHHRPAHLETGIIHQKIFNSLMGKEPFNLDFILQNLNVIRGVKNIAINRLAAGSINFYYYIMEDYEKAIEFAKEALSLRILVPNSLAMDFHDLFAFLALSKNDVYTDQMERLEKDAKQWSQQNPDNFDGYYQLILGEKYRIQNHQTKALKHYEKAVNDFSSKNMTYFVAIASELIANFYLKTKRQFIAKFYMKEAYYYYLIWGAQAKVELLEKNHPELTETNPYMTPRNKTLSSTNTTSTNTSGSIIDYLTLFKGLQAISQEINLENLISKIMQAMMENAGAQRMVLLLEQKETLVIMAESILIDNKPHTRTLNVPMYDFENLPKSLISYVQKTKEKVLVNFQNKIHNDKYFKKFNIKAALCLPIIQSGKNIGVIYLEHSSSAHAFNIDNLQSLQLLITQTAISLENAQIYSVTKRFVPFAFLEHLNRRNLADVSLGEHIDCNMTVLFADIRGFTAMSETLSSSEVFSVINQFLGACAPIVRKYGGFVDKYIGDAIMALFDISPDYVLKAAWEIKEAISDLKVALNQQNLPPLQIGIGINTGPLTLGIIGEEQRLESSVLGDSVNIAARIESLNKLYNTSILISKDTMLNLKYREDFKFKSIGNIQLPGRQEIVEIWELIDCDLSDHGSLILNKITPFQNEL